MCPHSACYSFPKPVLALDNGKSLKQLPFASRLLGLGIMHRRAGDLQGVLQWSYYSPTRLYVGGMKVMTEMREPLDRDALRQEDGIGDGET